MFGEKITERWIVERVVESGISRDAHSLAIPIQRALAILFRDPTIVVMPYRMEEVAVEGEAGVDGGYDDQDVIPRCSHGNILLGCHHGDCPEQNAHLAHLRAAADGYIEQMKRNARIILGLPLEG